MDGDWDWLMTAAYIYTLFLPGAGWAWEFLRRNAEYRADYDRARARRARRLRKADARLMPRGPYRVRGRAAHWGLLFPGELAARRAPRRDLLAA
jgi:hypothetical protein